MLSTFINLIRGFSVWVKLSDNERFLVQWQDKIRNAGTGTLGIPWNDQSRISIEEDPVHTYQDVFYASWP